QERPGRASVFSTPAIPGGPVMRLPPPAAPAPLHPGEGEAEPWLPEAPAEGAAAPDGEEEACRRLRVRGEYLLWWFKHMPLPPVLTRGDPTDALPGASGMPSTVILYGKQAISEGLHSGGRLL